MEKKSTKGLVAINFINDQMIVNKHPIMMYYNGAEDDVATSLVSNEELSQYIYKNLITLMSYPSTDIYAVSYFSNGNEDEEVVNKYQWKLQDIYRLDTWHAAREKLLYDILCGMTKMKNDTVIIIRELLNNGISEATISNYVRHEAENMTKDNVTELLHAVKEIIDMMTKDVN